LWKSQAIEAGADKTGKRTGLGNIGAIFPVARNCSFVQIDRHDTGIESSGQFDLEAPPDIYPTAACCESGPTIRLLLNHTLQITAQTTRSIIATTARNAMNMPISGHVR
jgi:hypothetical protein